MSNLKKKKKINKHVANISSVVIKDEPTRFVKPFQ